MFGFGKILLGVLIGVFVLPFIFADPLGTFETIQGVIEKLSELGGAIGGSVDWVDQQMQNSSQRDFLII